MLVARGLIDQPDLDSARRFLHEVRHASGINYMLADPSGVEDYECSRDQVHRFQPPGNGRHIAHTNHPLASTDRLDPEMFSTETRWLHEHSNEHSTHRMNCLENTFLIEGGAVDVDGIKQVLSSHDPPQFPICRHKQAVLDPMSGMTNNSLVMVMNRPAEMQLASGPPCISEFKTFEF